MKTNYSLGALIASTAAAMALSGSVSATPDTPTNAMVKCEGVNACKGHSDCKTYTNACKGQNSCKGRGIVVVSAKNCINMGGKIMR
jgi:hypothetical protein